MSTPIHLTRERIVELADKYMDRYAGAEVAVEFAERLLALLPDVGKMEAREITRAQWIGGNSEMSVPYGEYCESELFRLRMAVGDHDTDACIEILAALRAKLATALSERDDSRRKLGEAKRVIKAASEFDRGYSFQQHDPSAVIRLRKALAAFALQPTPKEGNDED